MTLIRYGTALVWIITCALLPRGGVAATFTLASQSLTPVRLCTSVPIGSLPYRSLTTGISHAVTLASEQWVARFRQARLALLPPLLLDDAAPDHGPPDTNRERHNAQQCAARSDTLGYIGPLKSGLALYSMPVLNRAGMVQISPGNSLPTLTSPLTRKAFEPATNRRLLAYPTYYRTCTTDALEGPSAAAYLKERLRATTYFLIDDQTQYGAGVAGAMAALRGSLHQRRAALLPYVAHARWHGATGITSFDSNGDTRNRIVSMYAVRRRNWQYVGIAPHVTGVSPAG
jgi:hypothetical protein